MVTGAEEIPNIDPIRLRQQLVASGYREPFEDLQFELLGRFSTDLWQLKLTGVATGTLPVLIVKKPYQADRTGESAEMEGRFYDQIAELLPVRTPPFIGCQKNLLILVKLLDLLHFDFKTGPVEKHADLAMEQYARVHACMWGKAGDFGWLPQLSDEQLRLSFQSDFDSGWKSNRELFNSLCPEFTPIGDALVGSLAATIEPLGNHCTLLHGDGHAENLPMTTDGDLVFLDWQAPRVGNPGFDIAVFIAMSFPVKKRRLREHDLVRRHYESIQAQGVDWPNPVDDFRCGLLRRAARIVEISARDQFSSLSWVFRRCATAAADHKVGNLII
jgi:hypothetical protein